MTARDATGSTDDERREPVPFAWATPHPILGTELTVHRAQMERWKLDHRVVVELFTREAFEPKATPMSDLDRELASFRAASLHVASRLRRPAEQ